MKRRRIPEIMDRPSVDEPSHAHALRSLNRVDKLLGIHQRQYRCLSSFGVGDMSILDLGCGGGGFLAHVAGKVQGQRPPLLVGLDRSVFALKCAGAWHVNGVQYVAADARRIPFADNAIDVVACSLFLHHFDAAEAVVILREAARVARLGVLVVDLARSRLAWALTWLVTRLVSRSWIFHLDGPRSVRAAFRSTEMVELARLAGLEGARVLRLFPLRLVLIWNKREASNGSL